MRKLFVLLIPVCISSCNSNSSIISGADIEAVNILSSSSDLQLNEDVVFDSLQYATGNFIFTLSGSIQVDEVNHEYSVRIPKRPTQFQSNSILSHVFPLRKWDTTNYNCMIFPTYGGCFVEWKRAEKRLTLFLTDSILGR